MQAVKQAMGFEKGDHVVVTMFGVDPFRAFIVAIEEESEIDFVSIEVQREGGDYGKETLTNKGEIRECLAKPVPGCDCYSCTRVQE